MKPLTKIGLWLFMPGAILMVLAEMGLIKEVLKGSRYIDEFAVLGMIAMCASVYGAIALIFSWLIYSSPDKSKDKHINDNDNFIVALTTLIKNFAIAAFVIYLVYLYVVWAGLIGTLLTIIVILLL